MTTPSSLCSVNAAERGDSMRGTAMHVNRFLLIEHPGPWGFDALSSSGILPAVREQLLDTTRAAGARTLLIRRHGRAAASPDRAWAVADILTGRIRWGRWRDDTDLLEARDTLTEQSEDWSTEPIVLVCTHGRHDTCCAIRGRPVATALMARHSDLVWEASHVGGDRFAASIVLLPDGTYYGQLDASSVGTVVENHLAGTVTTEHLRGSCLLSPVAQAAACEAQARFGPGGPRDVRSASTVLIGPERWQVELHCVGRLPARVVATVEAHHAAPAVLTCRAPRAASARSFVVTDLRVD